jgi:hypothetical protein
MNFASDPENKDSSTLCQPQNVPRMFDGTEVDS